MSNSTIIHASCVFSELGVRWVMMLAEVLLCDWACSDISNEQEGPPMSPKRDVSRRCKTCMKHEKFTATVPKIAPLAPTDGTPTREKLPPRTLLLLDVSDEAASA